MRGAGFPFHPSPTIKASALSMGHLCEILPVGFRYVDPPLRLLGLCLDHLRNLAGGVVYRLLGHCTRHLALSKDHLCEIRESPSSPSWSLLEAQDLIQEPFLRNLGVSFAFGSLVKAPCFIQRPFMQNSGVEVCLCPFRSSIHLE